MSYDNGRYQFYISYLEANGRYHDQLDLGVPARYSGHGYCGIKCNNLFCHRMENETR